MTLLNAVVKILLFESYSNKHLNFKIAWLSQKVNKESRENL